MQITIAHRSTFERASNMEENQHNGDQAHLISTINL